MTTDLLGLVTLVNPNTKKEEEIPVFNCLPKAFPPHCLVIDQELRPGTVMANRTATLFSTDKKKRLPLGRFSLSYKNERGQISLDVFRL